MTDLPPHRAPPNPAAGAQRHLSVLVVEDNVMNREAMRSVLRQLGHTADFVDNGMDAVARAMVWRYDVILMDVHMPGLDGITTTREICSLLGAQRPWIVAVTASLLPSERRSCFDAGMDDFLGKPLTIAKMAAVLSFSQASVDTATATDDASTSLTSDIAAARKALSIMSEGDPAALAECHQLLFDSMHHAIDQIHEAIAAEERAQVQFHAHTLRGVALAGGLAGVAHFAGHLETTCASLTWPELQDRARALTHTLAWIREGLSNFG